MESAEHPPLPRAVALLLLAAYIVIVSLVAVHHEPWRDEADAWLAARDAGPAQLWDFFRHGGTPGLWYLLLVPFARAGAPYGTQEAVQVVIAAIAAGVILFAAPFPRVVRALLPFSYYFGYEYAVIARSYALSVLLLAMIAALHRRRDDHPIAYAVAVGLLANTNVHSLCVAALIGLASLLERRRPLPIAIMLAGGLLAVAQVWPTGQGMVRGVVSVFHPEAPAQAVRAAFFPVFNVAPAAELAVGLAILVAAIWTMRRSRFALLVTLGSYALFGFIFVFKWLGGPRHFGFVLLVLLFGLCVADSRERIASRVCWMLVTVSVVTSILASVYVWRLDWNFAFSGARETAHFIHRRGMASYTVAAHSQTTAESVAAYFDHPFWYAGIEEFGTFSRWDREFARGLEVPYPEAVRRVDRRFPDRTRLLLLLNVPMPQPERHGWRLLFHNARPQFTNLDESYWLYGALP